MSIVVGLPDVTPIECGPPAVPSITHRWNPRKLTDRRCAMSSRRLDPPDGACLDTSDRVAGTEAIIILQDMTRSMVFGDDDQDTIHAQVRNEVGHVTLKAKLALITE